MCMFNDRPPLFHRKLKEPTPVFKVFRYRKGLLLFPHMAFRYDDVLPVGTLLTAERASYAAFWEPPKGFHVFLTRAGAESYRDFEVGTNGIIVPCLAQGRIYGIGTYINSYNKGMRVQKLLVEQAEVASAIRSYNERLVYF